MNDNSNRQPEKVANLKEFGETISKIFNNPAVKVVGFKLPKQDYYEIKENKDA